MIIFQGGRRKVLTSVPFTPLTRTTGGGSGGESPPVSTPPGGEYPVMIGRVRFLFRPLGRFILGTAGLLKRG